MDEIPGRDSDPAMWSVAAGVFPEVMRHGKAGARLYVCPGTGYVGTALSVAVTAPDGAGLCLMVGMDGWVAHALRAGDRRPVGNSRVAGSVVFHDRYRYRYRTPVTDVCAGLVTGLAAWADPDNQATKVALFLDGLESIDQWASAPVDRAGATKALMSVHSRDPGMLSPGPDGRYTIGGFTEPYPLAWPYPAVHDAVSGDLSTLWPYLEQEVP